MLCWLDKEVSFNEPPLVHCIPTMAKLCRTEEYSLCKGVYNLIEGGDIHENMQPLLLIQS